MGTSEHTQVHSFAGAEHRRSHSSSISLAALASILAIFTLSGCGGLASTEKKTSRITLTVNSSSINFGNISLGRDRKSTRLNSSHRTISYAVFCLKKKKKK